MQITINNTTVDTDKIFTECKRCSGTGFYHMHTSHGRVCFKCGGHKVQLTAYGKKIVAGFGFDTVKPGDVFAVGSRLFIVDSVEWASDMFRGYDNYNQIVQFTELTGEVHKTIRKRRQGRTFISNTTSVPMIRPADAKDGDPVY